MARDKRRANVTPAPAALPDGHALQPDTVEKALATVLAYLAANDVIVGTVRAGDGTYVHPGIGFSANAYDGFYRLSNGVVIYVSQASPAFLHAYDTTIPFDALHRWAPDGNLPGSQVAGTTDLGIGRLQRGILRITSADLGTKGTIQIAQPTARPAASAALRGVIWIEEGAAGVADLLYICAKDAADAYAWVRLARIADIPTGASGTFTTVDGKTVTVTNGLITAIV